MYLTTSMTSSEYTVRLEALTANYGKPPISKQPELSDLLASLAQGSPDRAAYYAERG